MLSVALALTLNAPASFDLTRWNQQRLSTNRVAMFVLGGWAVGNLAVGAVGLVAWAPAWARRGSARQAASTPGSPMVVEPCHRLDEPRRHEHRSQAPPR